MKTLAVFDAIRQTILTPVARIECHHGDYYPTTVEAVLVNAADALSAARPGARREILENYVHRLERLESIANALEGVSKSFAIQAGRELRIIVNSEKIATSSRSGSPRMWPGRLKPSSSTRARSR